MPGMDEPTSYLSEQVPDRSIDQQVPAWLDTSDPDWKYVSVRRLLIYLEHSIDEGTQWAVFEPNGEPLWAAVGSTQHHRLPVRRVAGTRVAGRAGRGCVLRQVRPHDDDPERPGTHARRRRLLRPQRGWPALQRGRPPVHEGKDA